jgi:hypothetical protein
MGGAFPDPTHCAPKSLSIVVGADHVWQAKTHKGKRFNAI